MSETRMGFFDALEHELREAAERGSRAARPPALAIAAAVVALTVAAVPVLAILGGGGEREPVDAGSPAVGTVIKRGGETHTVVATGESDWGSWQLESYGSTRLVDPATGEEFQPAGLRCLGLAVTEPKTGERPAASGQCGEFPRTPGFGRQQHTVPELGTPAPQRKTVVYGRAPEQATAVVLTVDGRQRLRVSTFEGPRDARGDFYLMTVPSDIGHGRVNWLDAAGRPGSRGIALLPP